MLMETAFASGAITKSIIGLYTVSGDVNTWMNGHIEQMKTNENQTICRTGHVLDAAKTGFGVGYVAPVTVIAVGQYLLGNTFAALGAVATAATFTNPVAMTCAAVGAIYYGWDALSKEEQRGILNKISAGLNIGIEFIKSVINLISTTLKEILSSENFAELKDFVRNATGTFGRKLDDVTRAISDKLADVVQASTEGVKRISLMAANASGKAAENVKLRLDQNGDGQLSLDDVVEVGIKIKRALAKDKDKD